MKNKVDKGFFDIDQYFDALRRDYPEVDFDKESYTVVFNGQRNIGKTTAALNRAIERSLRPDAKLVIMRNSKTQLDAFRADLNARYYGRFQFSAGMIYKSVAVEVEDKKTGTMEVIYRRGEHVGYLVAISTFATYKSLEFKDVNMIIHEEYNEQMNITYRGLYDHWISLCTTIMRFNTIEYIALGNREDALNEFMVNWEIDAQESYEKDNFYQFNEHSFFIEIGTNTFKELGNSKTLASELASMSPSTDRYAKGGYVRQSPKEIINFKKHVLPTFIPRYALYLRGIKFTMGNFELDGEIKFAVVSSERYDVDGLSAFSMDNRGDLNNDSIPLTAAEREERLQIVFELFRNRNLYFTSFEDLNLFMVWLPMLHYNK